MDRIWIPALVALVAISVSVATAMQAPTAPRPAQENFAVTVMHLVEPAATCTALYTDVGENHVHTAVCTKADVASLCRVGLDGLRCDPFEFGKKEK